MSKAWQCFWIDVVLFAQAVSLASTGAVMKWVLPPGSGGHGWGGGRGWGQGPRRLFEMSRHDWGELHFWIAVSLVAVLALHLVVHWRWIVCRFRDLRPSGRRRSPACDDQDSA
jgi:hypothetical protein